MSANAEIIAELRRVLNERDEARAEVERLRETKDYLRTWLSSEEMEGLRVKAAEHPLLWEEIHHLKAEVERLREMAHDFEAMREDRDEARAEVEHAYREGGALYEAKIAEREAFRSGAEAMRLACQQWCRAWENDGDAIADALADLRVEDKP